MTPDALNIDGMTLDEGLKECARLGLTPIAGGTGVETATILAYAAVAAAAVGTAVGAYSAYAQGEAQADAAKMNKKIAEQNAAAARDAANAEADNRRRRYDKILASQRARYGASGVIANEGTPLLVQLESEDEAALDVARTRYAGMIGAQGYQQEARIAQLQGTQARRAGRIAAGTSLLQGLSATASAYSKLPKSPGTTPYYEQGPDYGGAYY
jgi:hypothetical protein